MRFWFYGLVLLVFTTHAWAVDCGDTTGPGGTRVACRCGDRVTTNTKLRRIDPVVATDPTDVCAGDGLEVRSEVTLNCNNLTLRGSGVGAGVLLSDAGGVTIENCAVAEFEIGINLQDGIGSTVRNNVLTNNVTGLRCEEDCVLNVFTKNHVSANTGDGMSFNRDSVENEVSNNQVHDNGGDGIVVGGRCVANLLLHNVVSDNTGRGISIKGRANTIVENTGKRNGEHGLAVEKRLNVVTGNEFNRNGGHGICASPRNSDGGGNIGKKNGEQPDVTFSGC